MYSYFEWSSSSLPDTTKFVITPSPLTVAVEQGTATFQCEHPMAIAIGWRVNGMPLDGDTLQNVSAATPNSATSTLSIATLLAYHGTAVECIATFIDGSSPQFTPPVQLLIQGIHTVIVTEEGHCCILSLTHGRHPQMG